MCKKCSTIKNEQVRLNACRRTRSNGYWYCHEPNTRIFNQLRIALVYVNLNREIIAYIVKSKNLNFLNVKIFEFPNHIARPMCSFLIRINVYF